jgi:hypothetical protein
MNHAIGLTLRALHRPIRLGERATTTSTVAIADWSPALTRAVQTSESTCRCCFPSLARAREFRHGPRRDRRRWVSFGWPRWVSFGWPTDSWPATKLKGRARRPFPECAAPAGRQGDFHERPGPVTSRSRSASPSPCARSHRASRNVDDVRRDERGVVQHGRIELRVERHVVRRHGAALGRCLAREQRRQRELRRPVTRSTRPAGSDPRSD